jgi:hypothetical protein
MNSKIIAFGVSALGILMAFFVGRAVGQGQHMHIALVFGVMVGAPLVLGLGKNYWYLIPASLLSGLPAIPLGGRSIQLAELCIALCFGIFVTRVAFKLDKLVLWRSTNIPIYLFVAWVLFIFCLYPVGFAAFGATTMGARFYIQIIFAFMAFLVVSSREITEKDGKWIIIFIVAGSAINATYAVGSFVLFGPSDEILNPGADTEGYYTWHQSLASPALAVVFLLFAWKKPRDILGFRNFGLFVVYIIAIAITLYSGKRMAVIAVLLAPVVSAVVYRQYAYVFVGGLLALLLSFALIFGHGDLFRLPLQMQRALSWLPAKWDPEFQAMAAGRDPFRESLRRFAIENIERDPLIGRGFAIGYSEIIGQIGASRYLGGYDAQAAPYAIGRAWHNTWLGYAADFGIPLSVIQGILYLTVLIIAFKTSRAYSFDSLKSIIAIYILIFTVRDLFASHTSGHSALDAYARWWMYGLLFALYAATKSKSPQKRETSNPRELFLERLSSKKPSPVNARL